MDAHTGIRHILEQYAAEQDNLLIILEDIHGAQGYLSREALEAAAAYLKLAPAKVVKIAESAGRFRFLPRGRHHIKVCCGTACHVKGSRRIMENLGERLGLGAGERTADGRFSLEATSCQNVCSLGPYVNIDDEVYVGCSCDSIDDILDSLED